MKRLIAILALVGLMFKGAYAVAPPDEGMWLVMFIGNTIMKK